MLLHKLAEASGGVFGTLEQAVTEVSIPRVKSVRPTVSYRGTLNLGNPKEYQTAMSINVERFPCTLIAKPPAASNHVVRSTMASNESQATVPFDNGEVDDSGLSLVRNVQTYQVKDESVPGGKRDVKREDLAKGYEYGRSAVPISESDQLVTKLETKPVLEIVGFIPIDNVSHH